MPIKFIIEIDMEKHKGIRVETPASVASPAEVELGLAFKKAVDEFLKHQGARVTWMSPGNENRGRN